MIERAAKWVSRVAVVSVSQVAVAGCLAVGCGAIPKTPPASRVIFAISAAQREVIELDRSDCTQPADSRWEWQLVDNAGRATAAAPMTSTVVATNAADATGATNTGNVTGATLSARDIGGDTEYLSLTPSGLVALFAVDSPSDRVRTFFTPPLTLDVPRTPMPVVTTSSSAMRVEWIDGRGERDSGRGERSVRATEVASIMTSQGSFETLVIESEFQAFLRFAKVRRTMTTWIAPRIGCIAQRWDERVIVLGIEISRDCGTAVRVSPFHVHGAPLVP